MLVPKKLDNFTKWTLSEILLRFSIFQSLGGKLYFIQIVQRYTSPRKAFHRLLLLHAQVKPVEKCRNCTYQALSSFRITGFTVIVALTWHARCNQSVRLFYIELCFLSPVVPWSTALVLRRVK